MLNVIMLSVMAHFRALHCKGRVQALLSNTSLVEWLLVTNNLAYKLLNAARKSFIV